MTRFGHVEAGLTINTITWIFEEIDSASHISWD